MPPSPLQHRRTHNTLLFQKLLNLRDGASPFTLVLDTLEQSGGRVVREFVERAQVCDSVAMAIIFLFAFHLAQSLRRIYKRNLYVADAGLSCFCRELSIT